MTISARLRSGVTKRRSLSYPILLSLMGKLAGSDLASCKNRGKQ